MIVIVATSGGPWSFPASMENIICPLGVLWSSRSCARTVVIGWRASWNSVTETHSAKGKNAGTWSFSSWIITLHPINSMNFNHFHLFSKYIRQLLEGIAAFAGGVTEFVVVPRLYDERVLLLLLPVQMIGHHYCSRLGIDRKSTFGWTTIHEISDMTEVSNVGIVSMCATDDRPYRINNQTKNFEMNPILTDDFI